MFEGTRDTPRDLAANNQLKSLEEEIESLHELKEALEEKLGVFHARHQNDQAEIARLRKGLEVFSFTDNWTTFGEPRSDRTYIWLWDHSVLVPDPAAFAREVLEHKP